jgi:hypothetical protein
MASDLDMVEQLERELLTSAVRGDRHRLEQVLHPEFVEIGQSGHRWMRDEMIAELVTSPGASDVEVRDLVVAPVAGDVLLVTYVARRVDSTVHRSSLWVRHGDGWTVRVHQATPAKPSE